jgi:type VI secretion system protein ImpA
VAVYLARALTATNGLEGLAEGLALNRGLVERMWEAVHPKLDPEDDNDPTLRVNTLAGLADRDQLVNALRLMPLANSRRLGSFGLRDLEIANGTLPKPEGQTGPDMTTIEAAFLDMDGAELEASAQGAAAALEAVDGLDGALSLAVGAANSADFVPLRSTLRSIHVLLQQQLGRRGLGSGEVSEAADGGQITGGQAAGTGVMPAMSGPIQGREDVIRVLDQITDWYSKYEPASPVPLLLQRAKRLVNKNFLEAVQDLSPSGVTEVQNIAGVDGGG